MFYTLNNKIDSPLFTLWRKGIPRCLPLNLITSFIQSLFTWCFSGFLFNYSNYWPYYYCFNWSNKEIEEAFLLIYHLSTSYKKIPLSFFCFYSQLMAFFFYHFFIVSFYLDLSLLLHFILSFYFSKIVHINLFIKIVIEKIS